MSNFIPTSQVDRDYQMVKDSQETADQMNTRIAKMEMLLSSQADEIERLHGALHVAHEALKDAYSHTKSTSMANGYLERALNELHKRGVK